VAEKGICRLMFMDKERRKEEFKIFSEQWQFATLIHKPDYTEPYIRKIFQPDKN